MPYARDTGMRQLYNMFRVNQGAFPGVNPGTFADEANTEMAEDTARYKATSPEMQREQGILAGADARAEQGIQRDRAENDAVRVARMLGYSGSNPLQEQAQAQAAMAMEQKLAPERMKLQASLVDKSSQREFTAGQNELNRNAMTQRANISQGGQDRRLAARNSETQARNVEQGKTPVAGTGKLRSLFGWLPGIDSNEDIQSREAANIRSRYQPEDMSAGNESVLMRAPDGSERMIEASRVQEFLNKGAEIVQE
jgi:hypothetical protein